MGIKSQLCKMNKFRDLLDNIVHIVNNTVLYTKKCVKRVDLHLQPEYRWCSVEGTFIVSTL